MPVPDRQPEADRQPSDGQRVEAGPGRTRRAAAGTPLSVTVLAWCAGCREETEFVAPVGLTDAGPDELACLQCGWAVLVVTDAPDVAASRAA